MSDCLNAFFSLASFYFGKVLLCGREFTVSHDGVDCG